MEQVSTMGSGKLGCELDLERVVDVLADDVPAVREANFHNPSQVTIRLVEDGPAITLYRTGSFQIRGAKTRETLESVKADLLAKLRDIGVPLNEPSFEQKTAVFMEDLETEVDLERLAIALGLEDVEYEPEQFPGLVYRPPGLKATLLVFSTGKVIIGGTNSREEAQRGIEKLTPQVEHVAA